MSDFALQLATDIFARIERERKCQLHIIEDEVRCRLAANNGGLHAGDDNELRDAAAELMKCLELIGITACSAPLPPKIGAALKRLETVLLKGYLS